MSIKATALMRWLPTRSISARRSAPRQDATREATVGATLARRLSAARHTVLLANSRGPDTIADLAGEAGATAVPVAEAVKDVDVIIMSIPLGKIPSLKELLAEVPTNAAVADTSNYYPQRDGRIRALGDDPDQAEQALAKLGYAVCPHRVVNRAATRRSYALDQSVFEFEPGGKAAAEFQLVYMFTCSHETMRTETRQKGQAKRQKEVRYA